MFVLGLTGSMATGKSTMVAFFRTLGIPVFDSDFVVHELYGHRRVQHFIYTHAPQCFVHGILDRSILREALLSSPDLLASFEAVIHPLVLRRQRFFLWRNFFLNPCGFVVLDIPLLFEVHYESYCDAVMVVWCDNAHQWQRAKHRGLSDSAIHALLAKQISQEQKKRQGDFLIDTNRGLWYSYVQVLTVLRYLKHRF